MVFGMIDGSWAIFGNHVVRGSATEGVRTVSALANDPDADWRALQTVKKNADSLGRLNLERVVIYKANGFGEEPSTTCKGGTPVSGVCNVYDRDDLAEPIDEFGCDTGEPDRFWCPTDRKTATRGPDSPPDYIGVWAKVRHSPLLGVVIQAERLIERHSVQRIEPRVSG